MEPSPQKSKLKEFKGYIWAGLIDRSGWPPGPWDKDVIDRAEWHYEGLPCLVRRSKFGVWCGYVGVPAGHSWHDIDKEELDDQVHVHEGVTYAGPSEEEVCHKAKPEEFEEVWWIGFDCLHAGDMAPAPIVPGWFHCFSHAVYRDFMYVLCATEHLAEQVLGAG